MIINASLSSGIGTPSQFVSFNNRFRPRNEDYNSVNLVNEDRLLDTFIQTTKINTNSVPYPKEFPSTEGQKKLATHLKEELEKIGGLVDVQLDKKHYVVTATLPHNMDNTKQKIPTVGLLAHLDNFWAVSSDNIKVKIHEPYQGGDVILNKNQEVLIPADELTRYKGERLVTSDGTTQLGTDDKAGIAEILEVLKIYRDNPHIKHPTIKVAFTPDEENGQFIHHFNIKDFNVDYAYAVDAKDYHTYESDYFNANFTEVVVQGKNLHPGYAKGKLVNAVTIASDFIQKFPPEEVPEKTEGHEGFYFVTDIEGNPQEVKINLVIRDHDIDKFNERIEKARTWAQEVEEANPGAKVIFTTKPLYRNVRTILQDQYPELVQSVEEGITKTIQDTGDSFTVSSPPVRGGSDSVTLVKKGLPAICVPAGYKNAHGKNEFTTVEEMKKCTANLLNIMSYWTHTLFQKDTNKKQEE